MEAGRAARTAAARVEAVRDSTQTRYRLAEAFYRGKGAPNACDPYARAS